MVEGRRDIAKARMCGDVGASGCGWRARRVWHVEVELRGGAAVVKVMLLILRPSSCLSESQIDSIQLQERGTYLMALVTGRPRCVDQRDASGRDDRAKSASCGSPNSVQRALSGGWSSPLLHGTEIWENTRFATQQVPSIASCLYSSKTQRHSRYSVGTFCSVM